MEMEKVKEIMKNLENGFCYSSKDNFYGFDVATIRGVTYIIYNHYGSSAQRKTLSNLKWIIEVIFKNDISMLQPKKDGYIYY